MKILISSKNTHKIQEFSILLGDKINTLALPLDYPSTTESGAFFHDNAKEKIINAKKWLNKKQYKNIDGILADDSGLCIDALWGCPGVLTARFANHLPQIHRNKILLTMIHDNQPRSARFVCVISWMDINDERIYSFTGSLEGTISQEIRGNNGFGYDNIFIPCGMNKTLGELDSIEKNLISHRRLAVNKFLSHIRTHVK